MNIRATPDFPESMGFVRRWLWWKLLPFAACYAYAAKPKRRHLLADLVWRNL